MSVQLSEHQINLINKIAEEEGFSDFTVVATPGSCKGDNYMGVITTVRVKDSTRKLDLILKSALDSGALRKMAPIRKVFLREIYVYKTVFPALEEFQRSRGLLEGFSGHAKLYGTVTEEPNECLVLENLKEAGYRLWNRKIPMDPDHVRMVLEEYGRLHAVSFAMKEKEPERYEEMTDGMANVFTDMDPIEATAVMKGCMANGFNAIEGHPEAVEAFERFNGVVEKFLMEELKEPEEKSVLVHGDCWCNNLLFKYEDAQDTRPTKVCLIDWQLSWTGSPALDLAYFLMTCAPKQILSDYKEYLRVYHGALSQALRGLQCDAETLFPFDLLEQHWRKYAKYGIYLALIVVKLMLGDAEEVPDIVEIADGGKTFSDGFKFDINSCDSYNRRILDIVLVSADNGWI
ncbi:hypothetical protein NQ318_013352 [Aromia moschata]|uniref:CHK kinase-like domain-containing protein n=1 Tax=Aromia moschata TaxID=1265417 RepID=A0AAV8XVD6_9CUCU|nr:hypothetical protein NQ318_013352 [Aromia moschata]